MITAGVDLATEPAKTATATITWTAGRAVVSSVLLGADDDDILNSIAGVDVLGIDCPLGWPDDFVAFLQAHHNGHVVAPVDVIGRDWRRRLANRATDRQVHLVCGVTPLSVAADRIALTAMRAAGILARLADEGRPVDRSGSGVVVEVYPAASLKIWQLPHQGYKRAENQLVREQLIASLLVAAPWLDLGSSSDLCVRSDDALDAVIAALTARAHKLGLTTTPAAGLQREQATREGWIALPTQPLSTLVRTPPS
ncbi:MAG: DUF429 domain-containing protein [Kineosporiaceae bacterium]|nr:DUF429 domain-containing protein [Kineosporiaceae bacterium]